MSDIERTYWAPDDVTVAGSREVAYWHNRWLSVETAVDVCRNQVTRLERAIGPVLVERQRLLVLAARYETALELIRTLAENPNLTLSETRVLDILNDCERETAEIR